MVFKNLSRYGDAHVVRLKEAYKRLYSEDPPLYKWPLSLGPQLFNSTFNSRYSMTKRHREEVPGIICTDRRLEQAFSRVLNLLFAAKYCTWWSSGLSHMDEAIRKLDFAKLGLYRQIDALLRK